ncbi:MAG: carbon storage regulator CsrA [Lachnospiraceae bacterium]|jgi:carbon storage regulator (csrA)|nr:carbon storage regulator CsrA [Lachnospiraceae bacterium]RKI30833.1 carbon storage regulator [bacterium D16-36]RKI73244.1 carbon storage regulator [bacterium 1xD8-6]
MLALARKVNQSIVIGNDIEVTLLEIKGDQIKIGINAPKSVPIYRKEIFAQIQEENKSAMQEVDVSKVRQLFQQKE